MRASRTGNSSLRERHRQKHHSKEMYDPCYLTLFGYPLYGRGKPEFEMNTKSGYEFERLIYLGTHSFR